MIEHFWKGLFWTLIHSLMFVEGRRVGIFILNLLFHLYEKEANVADTRDVLQEINLRVLAALGPLCPKPPRLYPADTVTAQVPVGLICLELFICGMWRIVENMSNK